MPDLSPPTQAVLSAYRADWKDEQLKQDVKCLAAALRAAALILQQAYADESCADHPDDFLLAIADELEAQ